MDDVGPGHGDGRGRSAHPSRRALRGVVVLACLGLSSWLAAADLVPEAAPDAAVAAVSTLPAAADVGLDSATPAPADLAALYAGPGNGRVGDAIGPLDLRPPQAQPLSTEVFGSTSAAPSSGVPSTTLDEAGLFALALIGLVLMLAAGRARR